LTMGIATMLRRVVDLMLRERGCLFEARHRFYNALRSRRYWTELYQPITSGLPVHVWHEAERFQDWVSPVSVERMRLGEKAARHQ
jgi:hypothetical protein